MRFFSKTFSSEFRAEVVVHAVKQTKNDESHLLAAHCIIHFFKIGLLL
jgi:hypothetical protein